MDLGDCREALAELGRISQLGRSHFEVMQVRWHVHNRMKECLVLLGRLDKAVVRPPLMKLPADKIARLQAALGEAGIGRGGALAEAAE